MCWDHQDSGHPMFTMNQAMRENQISRIPLRVNENEENLRTLLKRLAFVEHYYEFGGTHPNDTVLVRTCLDAAFIAGLEATNDKDCSRHVRSFRGIENPDERREVGLTPPVEKVTLSAYKGRKVLPPRFLEISALWSFTKHGAKSKMCIVLDFSRVSCLY